MTKTKTKTIDLQKQLALLLTFATLALFALYIYFLCMSVMHVVIRTENEHLTKKIRTEISTLESQYILAHHNVSQQIASLDGYTTIADKSFIDRTQTNLVLGNALTN